MQQLHFNTEKSFKEFWTQFRLIQPHQFFVIVKENSVLGHSLGEVSFLHQHIDDLVPYFSYKKQIFEYATQKTRFVFHYETFIIYIDHHPYASFFCFDFSQQTVEIASTYIQLTDHVLMQRFNSTAPEMQDMIKIILKVAKTPFPVLVRGESGSGKEWVAKTIHEASDRAHNAFIAVNCAALNANILESELFGHVKGAFTGAIRDHKGVFERAEGGTLFLDEIAEIPLDLQAKLLRVLETGEFTRLGGEKVLQTNIRIITATHRALREEARLGRFRQDLLYRLRVIPIFIPALRDRKEDLPLLIHALLKENALINPPQIHPTAMHVLEQYDWPGNIRELKNTLLYALTMAQGKAEITIEDLPKDIFQKPCYLALEQENFDTLELKEKYQMLMKKHANNLNIVAQILGMSRSTLWRYRKKWES